MIPGLTSNEGRRVGRARSRRRIAFGAPGQCGGFVAANVRRAEQPRARAAGALTRGVGAQVGKRNQNLKAACIMF